MPKGELLLIAGAGDPVIADFVAFAARGERRRIAVISTADVCRRVEQQAQPHPVESFSKAGFLSGCDGCCISAVVIFLARRLTPRQQAALDAVIEIVREQRVERVCIVSSFRVHFGDRQAVEAEARVLRSLEPAVARTVFFRPGHVLSPSSRATAYMRALWFVYPLVPERLTSCFIDGKELFTAIEQEMSKSTSARGAAYTLFGPNRTWRTLLVRHKDTRPLRRCLAVVATLLSLLFVGRIAALLLDVCARLVRRLRRWNFDTLAPESPRELLALYNKYNYRHVKVVGYNNGVVHFGQRHPGKTVVSTVRCNQVARVNGCRARFDGGVTVRQALDVLGRAGKELHVIPNYSYVSLGTSFFIPIHGSASEFSTMADTIERVLLYDPVGDRFISATRDDLAFGEHLYNLGRDVLLLRLVMRVKEKSPYYLKRVRVENATSQDVLSALRDKQASNVEIRKARAADGAVDICKYYTEPPAGSGEALPFPRDSLGRLWDKLEANPVSSFLFHLLVRRFIYHVELFFRADEFATFWETHASLPVMKIQLRYIKQDGLPHSPFVNHDCVSVDMNMLRKHKHRFDAYVKETFRAVQFNPGKHSM